MSRFREKYVFGIDFQNVRYAVAELVKNLIAVREKFEPGFLGDPEAYRRWGVVNVNDHPAAYLQRALDWHSKVYDELTRDDREDPVLAYDPLGEFKMVMIDFVDQVSAREALESIANGGPVDWNRVADWQNIPYVRFVLDSLPHFDDPKRHDEAGGSDIGPLPLNLFLFRGKEIEVPSAGLSAILRALWIDRGRCLSYEELMPEDLNEGIDPWFYLELDIEGVANKFFEQHAMPFRVEIDEAEVSLIEIRDAVLASTETTAK